MHQSGTRAPYGNIVSAEGSTPEDAPVFTCRLCGECCRGKGGIVLRQGDQIRLAAFFNMPVSSFLERYAEQRGTKLHISMGSDGCCAFFDPKKLCTVHQARPDICRAWPFFRGNLVDPVSLSMAKEYCPGIDKKVTFARFARSGAAALAREGLLCEVSEHDPTALTSACAPATAHSSQGISGS